MLGRSGCGKGTQVKLLEQFLSQKQEVSIVNGGQLLRNLIGEKESIPIPKQNVTFL